VRSARAFDDGRWRLLAPLEKERRLQRLGAAVVEEMTRVKSVSMKVAA
jgi:hypothetical protein